MTKKNLTLQNHQSLRTMNKSHRSKKILPFLFFLGLISCSYLPQGSPTLEVEENADYMVLRSSFPDNDKAGIIFYPGGLVDPHAYILALEDLVLEDNRTVVILKVTSNLAIWNSQKATSILADFPAINKWVVGGHSLGGSTACIDLFNNPESFDGLFLLAAYSVNELSAVEIPVISITCSEDQVLDQTKLSENAINLPTGMTIASPDELPIGGTVGKTIYYEIEGGNHAQFGSYGDQEGDGTATISPAEQHKRVNEMLRQFLLANNL